MESDGFSQKLRNISYMQMPLISLFLLNNPLVKKMKTTLNFILCILGTIAISAQCKAQSGGSATAQHLIDSLKITDPDEIAICKLYDDAVTTCLTELKQYTSGGAKPTQAQTQAINKKFQDREKEIRPQVESFRKKVASNYQQLMNFSQFVNYETMRVYGSMYPNQKGGYPNYPMPANH